MCMHAGPQRYALVPPDGLGGVREVVGEKTPAVVAVKGTCDGAVTQRQNPAREHAAIMAAAMSYTPQRPNISSEE